MLLFTRMGSDGSPGKRTRDMSMFKYIDKFLLVALAFFCLFASVSSAQVTAEPRAVRGGIVTVRINDIPETDLAKVNGEYNVDASLGTIKLPYLEKPLYVAGKTARQVEDLIRSEYVKQQIYKRPIVQATVVNSEELKEAMVRYVTVSGYVLNKKNVRYREGMTLLEAILECGDITDYGSRNIQVTRRNVTRTYDYFSAKDRSLKLMPDDQIFVQKRGAFEGRPGSVGR